MIEIKALNSDTIGEAYSQILDFLYHGEGTIAERKNQPIKIIGKETTIGKAAISVTALKAIADGSSDIEFDETDLFDGSSAGDVDQYIRDIAKMAVAAGLNERIKEKIFEVIQNLLVLSTKVNEINGITVDLYSLAKMYKTNPEAQALIDFQLDETKTLDEMTEDMAKLTKEVERVFSAPGSPYRELIKGGAVNKKQLTQMISCVGLKPDLDDNICEHPVNTSFIKGLRSIEDFWVSATGARKALVISHHQVRRSGYLARKLLLLTSDIVLADVDACNTAHPLELEIPDMETFKRLEGRVAEDGTVLDGSEEQFKKYNGRLKIYSPMTCACKTGICRRCYGKLFDMAYSEHYRVGSVGVLLLTSCLTQRLLSAKHLSMAQAKPIERPKGFSDFFEETKNVIKAGKDLRKISLLRDDFKEDDEGNLVINRITIKNKKSNVVFDLPFDLYPIGRIKEELEEFKHEYNIAIEDDEELFAFHRQNVELNESLMNLISLIQTDNHNGIGNDYTAIANRFLRHIVEGSIPIVSVHAETILSALLRNADGVRPDFSLEDPGPITVLRLSEGINTKNLSTILSFENLRKKLQEIDTYERNIDGIYDEFFLKGIEND